MEGNTVLGEQAIDDAVYPFEGPDKTVSDIEAARAALEKAYQSRGFQTVYVVIPQQTVKGGVVRLKAVETKIGAVAIKGQNWSAPGEVKDQLPSLTSGAVPNLNNLNNELTALNSQSTDRQVTPQMHQGKAPDTIDVDLEVKDHLAVHGGLEINNKFSRDTTHLRLQANAEYDDLWGMGHSLSGLYSVAPQNPADGEVYALTYSAPVPDSDVKLSLTGLRSNSNVATLGSTDVLGRGWSATLSATKSLGSLGDYFHYVQASLAYKRFTDTISLTSASTTGSGNTTTTDKAPITYYPFSLSYVSSWRDAVNQASLNVGMTFSLRGLGSDQPTFDYARYKADGDFVYFRGALSWQRTLPFDFEAYGELDGQLANRPLVSNEQFSIGGDGSVRGYLQSEGLGDDGYRTSVELRSPNLGPFIASWVNDLRVVGFFDTAEAWLLDPLPNQQSTFRMSSFGPGMTGEVFDHFYGSFYWGTPITSQTLFGRSGVTQSWHGRPQFRVWTQF